jgi:hypothetical protein
METRGKYKLFIVHKQARNRIKTFPKTPKNRLAKNESRKNPFVG